MNSIPANNPEWLTEIIINEGGTISFYDYMNFVLNDPINGYYGSGKAELGIKGDFVTSPSLSDDFASLLGKQIEDWLIQIQGKFIFNEKLSVIEFGAGDGNLIKGIIQYFLKNESVTLNSLSFVIIEPNKGMIKKQKKNLNQFLNSGIEIFWKCLDELEENSINGIFIANEVLDALPVERLTFLKGKLYRQLISLNMDSGSLCFDIASITKELEKSIYLAKKELGIEIPPKNAPEGWTTEWHVDNSLWLKEVYKRINNGVLLIIDYAKEAKNYYSSRNSDGTLISYKNQKIVSNILDSPGKNDLTSHLCIETLINDAENLGFEIIGTVKQGEALLALGLAERLYEMQNEFKHDISKAFCMREALLRLVDPICLGDFKWFIFNKFEDKRFKINSKCVR